jgi:predicted Zn finger-like uncharacterized protein
VQAACPQCGSKIVIDDAKVPDRPFQVRCPKCQAVAKFPGRTAAVPPPAEEAEAPAPPAVAEDLRAQVMAQVRREMVMGGGGAAGHAGHRALVAIADRALAGNVTVLLSRLGYEVDAIDDAAEGGRLMEQGVQEIVVTTRTVAAQGKPETLYQRLNRLSPEARRRLFVILVGDDLKTGDGTQAWVCLADVVVGSRDVASADNVVRSALAERNRLYQAFNEARRRHDEAAS